MIISRIFLSFWSSPSLSTSMMSRAKSVTSRVITPSYLTWAKSLTRFNSRLASLGVPLERLATIKLMKNDMVLGSLPSLCPGVTSFADMSAMYQAIQNQGMVGFIPGFSAGGESAEDIRDFSMISLKNTEHPNQLYLCMVTCSDRKLKHQEEVLATCIRRYFRAVSLRKDNDREETSHED